MKWLCSDAYPPHYELSMAWNIVTINCWKCEKRTNRNSDDRHLRCYSKGVYDTAIPKCLQRRKQRHGRARQIVISLGYHNNKQRRILYGRCSLCACVCVYFISISRVSEFTEETFSFQSKFQVITDAMPKSFNISWFHSKWQNTRRSSEGRNRSIYTKNIFSHWHRWKSLISAMIYLAIEWIESNWCRIYESNFREIIINEMMEIDEILRFVWWIPFFSFALFVLRSLCAAKVEHVPCAA